MTEKTGPKSNVARRYTEHGSGLGKYRWVVERFFAWLHAFRKMRLVTEKTQEMLAGRAARAGVSVDEVERQTGASVSIGRIVTADEVASVVAFLASPRSVAINGDAIAVGGGAVGPIFY